MSSRCWPGPLLRKARQIPKYGELEGKKPHEIAAEKEAEKAYQKSLGRIPEQKASSDPWGTVRSEQRAQDGGKGPSGEEPKAAGTAN